MSEEISGGFASGIGGAINSLNSFTLDNLILLGQAAAGELGGDVAIMGIKVVIDGEVQAGGLVELQFRIDQMMAVVQECIKNMGKVSQTREAAARA